jgi:stage II sporulation protein D
MLSALLCLALHAAHAAERKIQIGIAPRVDDVALVLHGRYTTGEGSSARALADGKRLALEAQGKGLALGSLVLPAEARLTPHGDGAFAEIDGKRYGGGLILRRDEDGGTVTVVEEVGIEDYLLGVLPYEMDPSWPVESLKAQAVVARTFAYTQLGKYRKEGYDLSTDTRSQVYRGRGDGSPSIKKAVESTRGEVLGYKGQILNVYYHSCCGGHTTSAASVWGGEAALPPLRGVEDRYCARSPHNRWTAYATHDQLLAALDKRRLVAGVFKGFDIDRRDAAGYVASFVARVGAETLRVKAGDLRSGLSGTLRSLRILKLKRRSKGVEFVGGGSGHGVGLCQWGARIQAEQGRSYEKILKFYFPGSTLSVVDE